MKNIEITMKGKILRDANNTVSQFKSVKSAVAVAKALGGGKVRYVDRNGFAQIKYV